MREKGILFVSVILTIYLSIGLVVADTNLTIPDLIKIENAMSRLT